MENFILYEQLGSGRNSVVHKARRKGNLNHVAIICTNKAKRPAVTNHVRLCHDMNHANIVQFYEWYETTSHIWLVVELCTGGSLESLLNHDGCLSEPVVRSFGWDLVQGLKHIHELGIIYSDLTPAKILLDGSGMLKLGNFCLSKAEGENLEDIFSAITSSDESVGGDTKHNCDDIKKRLRGSLTFCAPEVLNGFETTMKSDLWALGCILYHMYTGQPPFYSDIHAELTDMILHQEVPPLTQTVSFASPPSQDFQSLLKGLLNKDSEKRMDWPELLQHPFWVHLLMEEHFVTENLKEMNKDGMAEQDACRGLDSLSLRQTWPHNLSPPRVTDKFLINQSAPIKLNPSNGPKARPFDQDTDHQQNVKHMSHEPEENDQGLEKELEKVEGEELQKTEDDLKLRKIKQMCHNSMRKSFTLLSELKPKNVEDEDSTEAIFLLSPCGNSRKNFSALHTGNQNVPTEASAVTDFTHCIKELLHTEADMTITPIIDNPKILKSTPLQYDSRSLCVPAYSAQKLLSLSDEEWPPFVLQLCSCLEGQRPADSSSPPSSPAVRSRLNLLCYLCCVVGHKDIANRLINSTLLQVLTQQLRQAPNWDIRAKVLRVLGLLALHCSDLREDSPVSEALSTLMDLLRENQRNNKIKQLLLPPIGEFLYLISSQEKRGSPEGLWFVPAAAYTGLMRSLREGDDSIVHHMAAKAVENIATTVSDSSHSLVTTDLGSALWHLFTHSNVEAVRVTAISALSRLTRVVPAVFLTIIDTCGPSTILQAVGNSGARVQQHLLTAVTTALLTSRVQTHRFTQSKQLVLKVLHVLESPSIVTRAKTLLLLLLLIQDNTHTLLDCCHKRLVMYLERDLRKATPLRENSGQSAYLSQCVDLTVAYLSSIAPAMMEDTLCTFGVVIGKTHPSTAQGKQLKLTLPTLSVVRGLCSSQVLRCQIVTEDFLTQIGSLLGCIASVESDETYIPNAVGVATWKAIITTTLSIVEVLSQHHAVITPYNHVVVNSILPPLTSLAFSGNGACAEWTVFVLRVLTEISFLLLLQQDCGLVHSEEMTNENKEKEEAMAKGRNDANYCSQLISFMTESLFPRYDSLLRAAEPIPLNALKLLVSMTDHSNDICRLVQNNRILPAVFQIIQANSSILTSGLVQNAVVLLCNLCANTSLAHQPQYQQGLIETVVTTFPKAAAAHLEEEEAACGNVCHLVLQALLELLHSILKQTTVVVRSAQQSQRLSRPTVETETAEKLLLANRPLSQLSTHLIHMLSSETQEVWEESLQCLSLLVQLYRGEGDDCLSPSCLRSFSQTLRSQMIRDVPQTLRTTLRIIKRLVQTSSKTDWFHCAEGTELINLLKDVTTYKSCHVDVASLAADILEEISAP